ncbi:MULTISPECIES: inositol monophosphatase [unclassified Guyparkeria]|uniref:inositol monophosphatase family protein n=1 Tax=unclassified Guyparkeria TaxID=2626246 RepID=UPI00073394F9|nr:MULTISPECIES: inositol monophosphatase [unclassified Guyparkeria]KTG16799.1 inositol monophosphatase [Guyparkeria sp. XI15]OAE85833.1 inositol monophosphatase [Guyparkeria sp. WRN-7]
MTQDHHVSPTEQQTVIELVRSAAAEHLTRAGTQSADRKADGSWITATDEAMQAALQEGLAERFAGHGFLGEEMSVAEQEAAWRACLDGQPTWVVDPLDGTSNFRIGFPVYSVTVALLVGGRTVFGVVFDPCRDECFHAARDGGAWLNGEPLSLKDEPRQALGSCLATVDFKRLPKPVATRLACEPPYASQRSIGSVALDWCWVAAHRVQVYVHGKQKLWDYAAGQLVLQEAGGTSAELDGRLDIAEEPLEPLPRSAVAATHVELLEEWLDVLTAES